MYSLELPRFVLEEGIQLGQMQASKLEEIDQWQCCENTLPNISRRRAIQSN